VHEVHAELWPARAAEVLYAADHTIGIAVTTASPGTVEVHRFRAADGARHPGGPITLVAGANVTGAALACTTGPTRYMAPTLQRPGGGDYQVRLQHAACGP
jgi:hypothetical protein